MMRLSVLSALLIIALGLLVPAGVQAYTGESPVMQVRVAWPSADQVTALRALPDLDIMKILPGEEITLVSDADQVEQLRALGLDVTIEIDDLEAYYASQREGYRNFGDLYTYDEMVAYLDEFHAEYPQITTAKYSIGTTHEGRTIWAFKVSDNPELNEPDEPDVAFDGLHHAREPITVNVLVETIRTLCEGYGVDPAITFLVDNRETYFVPVVNVDGYVYNEQTYPSGGGMWRKNRRPPVGGCYGVDPNRNYPYQWGGVGSSSDPCDETYKGPSAGSEPCVQAIMNFHNSLHVITHDSYHSVAGLILIPWSYTTVHTANDAQFRLMGNAMRAYNGYTMGQPPEVLYACSGTTTDWAYYQNATFSFCTEVDGSDFWPQNSEVPGLVAENIPVNLYLMRVAGGYPELDAMTLSGGNGDQKPDPGETLDLVVTLENSSPIAAAPNCSMTLHSNDAYLHLADAAASIGTIAEAGTGSNAGDPFTFSVDPTCPVGHRLAVTVEVVADGFAMAYPYEWLVGDLPIIFSDTMESGPGDWTHAAGGSYVDQWHLSTQRNHTAGGTQSWKFGSTTTGNYADLADGRLMTPVFDLGAMTQVTFWHWMQAEESSTYHGRAYDGGLIEMSVDGGAWEQVTPDGGYTHTIRTGSQPGALPDGTPVFSGTLDWRQETISLNGLSGQAQLRFRFCSDGNTGREGWYVDDIRIVGISGSNLPPTAPALASPAIGATVITPVPALTVHNATDPNPGTQLTYGFQVFGDALLTDLVASVDGVAEGQGTTSWTVTPPLENGTYYWRAYAFDGVERGPCMDTAWFVVEASQGIAENAWAHGLELLGAWPNPTSGAAALRFAIGSAGQVRAEIYDLQGRRVRELDGRFEAGQQALPWDGRDAQGRAVPAGVYLYVLKAGEGDRSGRLLRLR
jgi:carboxypeptidase T